MNISSTWLGVLKLASFNLQAQWGPILSAPRSSGAAPFDPANYGTVLGWWKADALSLNDGDPVATWTDSSAAGNNGTQSTSGNRPVYKTAISGFNGKPSVLFDGSNDSLLLANAQAGPVTYFAVFKSVTATFNNYYAIIDGNVFNNNLWGIFEGGTDHFYNNSPTTNPTAVYKDGTALGAYNSSLGTITTVMVLTVYGSTNTNSDARSIGAALLTYFGNFYLAELILYQGSPSTGNRQSVEAYLKAKYNTP